ncbi:MAG: NAD(P)H-binding protein [Pseudoxanthomonas sp.]
MTTIAVFGGTGYTGGNIVREAASRGGLSVLSVSRSQSATPPRGVATIAGSLPDVAESVVGKADVIVAALSPRGDSAGKLLGYYQRLATLAAAGGKRLIAIGGFSSLRPAPDAPRFAEGELPPELGNFKQEVLEMNGILGWLQNEAPESLDWLFVSPAETYVSFNPGQTLGRYRIGGDVALRDADGKSEISGADFALAIVDEIVAPKHSGHISVAY